MKKIALKSSKVRTTDPQKKIQADSSKDENEKPRSKRGFAAQSPEKLKEIASKGGKKSRGGGRTPKSALIKNDEQGNTSVADGGNKSKRGFASMDESKRKSIASMGGKISKGGGRPASSAKKTKPKK